MTDVCHYPQLDCVSFLEQINGLKNLVQKKAAEITSALSLNHAHFSVNIFIYIETSELFKFVKESKDFEDIFIEFEKAVQSQDFAKTHNLLLKIFARIWDLLKDSKLDPQLRGIFQESQSSFDDISKWLSTIAEKLIN